MGWSCRAEASRAMDRLEAACRRSTGQQNVFLADGRKWFYEIDRVDHEDGRVTGEYLVYVGKDMAERVSTFTIVADGSEMIGGHKWMRDRVAGL